MCSVILCVRSENLCHHGADDNMLLSVCVCVCVCVCMCVLSGETVQLSRWCKHNRYVVINQQRIFVLNVYSEEGFCVFHEKIAILSGSLGLIYCINDISTDFT